MAAQTDQHGGKIVLYVALAANLGIAVAKFVAAGVSGSIYIKPRAGARPV